MAKLKQLLGRGILMTITEIIVVISFSLIATGLFRGAQICYPPLWQKVGLQPFLFAVASVAIGFFFGWIPGVIFFIVYFLSNIVITGLTMELQMDRSIRSIEDDSSSYDNNPNVFYCPKCGERNDTKNQFNLSEKRICQSCLTVFK